MGWDRRCFSNVCISIGGLFCILLVSVPSTSMFNCSNTKLRISFSYLSCYIAVSLSRMKASLLKRMLHKNGFLITFITCTLKKIHYSLVVLESLLYFGF